MIEFKTALGMLAGSLVSGLYLMSSRSMGWWMMLITFAAIVGWIRWEN